MFPTEFKSILDGIVEMRIRGAALIAISGAEALAVAVENGIDIDTARDAILATRPTAVSLRNAVDWVMEKAEENGGPTAGNVRRSADDFKMKADDARRDMIRIGSPLIEDGRYLTHCNSSAVVDVLADAKARGKDLHVYATETRPWHQGHITTRALAGAGIPATLIVDSASRYIMTTEGIDMVLFGADTITSDGRHVNKIGTAQIASSAHELGIPVYVFAESFKFQPPALAGSPIMIEERPVSEVLLEPIEGVSVRNPVFDIDPPDHITGYVTELGILDPKEAWNIVWKEG